MSEEIQGDIKYNKIKEGLLVKRSRILKEWKDRHIVLTKTHLYSFDPKHLYKQPTEVVPLHTIQTVKSYHQNQYERPFIIRIESPDVNIYLSTKNSQEKISWITAILKMIEKSTKPHDNPDNYNNIRQSIKISSAFKESYNSLTQLNRCSTSKSISSLINQMKLTIYPNNINLYVHNSQLQILKHQPNIQSTKTQHQQSHQPPIQQLFLHIANSKIEKIKPYINFIVFILTNKLNKYHPFIFTLITQCQQGKKIIEAFLLALNEQTQQDQLNSYLLFLKIILENTNEEYLYTINSKAIVDILLRQIEMNRSDYNQFLIITLLQIISNSNWWIKFKYRKDSIIKAAKEIATIGGSQSSIVAKQLYKFI